MNKINLFVAAIALMGFSASPQAKSVLDTSLLQVNQSAMEITKADLDIALDQNIKRSIDDAIQQQMVQGRTAVYLANLSESREEEADKGEG